MSFGGPLFVIALVAMCMIAWVLTTAIRARHGYPLTDDWGNPVNPVGRGDDEVTRSLKAENDQLKDTVGKLEERLRVLERITTDPSRRLAEDIDNLR